MKITYDKTTDTTKRLSDDIAVDYDSSGKMAGIEVLGAKRLAAKEWSNRNVEYREQALAGA